MLVVSHDCPRCDTKGAAMTIHERAMEIGEGDYRNYYDVLATCLVCKRSVVATISTSGSVGQSEATDIEVHAMAPKPADTSAPEHTPENVGRFYKQGMENLSKNWDAAGTMFRKALEAGLKAKWPNEKGSLFGRIDSVAAQGGLTKDMKEWAHQIRLIGNDAAHEEEPIERKQAQEIATFTRLFLLYAFTLPGMLDKARGPAEDHDES